MCAERTDRCNNCGITGYLPIITKATILANDLLLYYVRVLYGLVTSAASDAANPLAGVDVSRHPAAERSDAVLPPISPGPCTPIPSKLDK